LAYYAHFILIYNTAFVKLLCDIGVGLLLLKRCVTAQDKPRNRLASLARNVLEKIVAANDKTTN